MTKILRKPCSSLVKIVSDGVNNFTQNKYNKLQKISAQNKCFFLNKWKGANLGSSEVQLHGVDLIDMQIQNRLYELIFILYKTNVTIYSFSGNIIIFVHKV